MARVSVLTAVYDPEREHLEACLASVRSQTFSEWEHVIVDDGSSSDWLQEVLAAAAGDPRVTVIRRPTNGGIAAASGDALSAATGDLIALLDHDDVLEPEALAEMVAAFDADDEVDVAYSDNDLLRPDGRAATPFYKPDFSPERLRSQNYIVHLLVARRSLVIDVGGFRTGFEGAQDHDLVLRLGERARRIAHVPRILYHWRQAPSSVSADSSNKPWAFGAGVRAVQDHCDRVGIPATVELTEHDGCYRVRRRVEHSNPVSVVIPTNGSSGRVWGATRSYVVEAVRSMIDDSTHPIDEFVIVVDDGTPDSVTRTLRSMVGDRLRLVPYRAGFNFSAKVNLGFAHASNDLVLLLNDDTELIGSDSLEVMVAHIESADDVAMVGAKLLFEDGTLQHGGHVYHHDLLPALTGWQGDAAGPWPLRPLAVERECSGVTAAAALIRHEVFDAVGGFTEDLPLNYNDVDFSLKLRAAGHRIIWTPWATWYHFESRTRRAEVLAEEYDFINQRWHHEINHDPYYNENLMPDRADWLERPLRSGAPPVESPSRARPGLRSLLSARRS